MNSRFLIFIYLLLLVRSAILELTAVPINEAKTAIRRPTNLSEVLFFKPEYLEVVGIIKQQVPFLKSGVIPYLTKQTNDEGVLYQLKTYQYILAVKTARRLAVFSFPMSPDVFKLAQMREISQVIGITPANYIQLPAVSGFKPFTDYENSSFHAALKQTWQQHFAIAKFFCFLKAELFVSSQFYYFRLIYVSQYATPKPIEVEVTACLAFEQSQNQTTSSLQTAEEIPFDPSSNSSLMLAFQQLRSQLLNYRLVTVQSLPNETHIFVFQKKNINISKPFQFQQEAFKVQLTPTGTHDVDFLWKNRAKNYDFGVISSVSRLAEAKWEELSLMKLEQIQNIRFKVQNGSLLIDQSQQVNCSGLRLLYRNRTNNRTVEFDLFNEKEEIRIY